MLRVLALILSLALSANSAHAGSGIILNASTDSLEVLTSAAVSTDYHCSYVDTTTTAFTPGSSNGNISTATTTTIVAAPGASTTRQIKVCSIYNRDATTAQTVTFKFDVSATERYLFTATLAAGESIQYTETEGFTIRTSTGYIKQRAVDYDGYNGRSYVLQKASTAPDAAGYWYSFAKDAGAPGAYVLQAPGLNGYNTDCSIASQTTNPNGAAQMGANQLPNPTSGSWFLTAVQAVGSQAGFYQLIDVLWYNTGLVVTTTTGQGVTMGALPARDLNGATSGEGVMAALLTTTANTNGATISNTTLTYTNSAGTGSRTATFSAQVGWQAPASPVIGTWMPFQLQAGDRGIQSVQTITLGTSYVAGALSLVLYRPLASIPNTTANVGGIMTAAHANAPPGIRLYNGTCIWEIWEGTNTASAIGGTYNVMER